VTGSTVPEALRRAIEGDMRPVKPLPPAWLRTLAVVAVAALAVVAALTTYALRHDIDALPGWLSWGSSALQFLVGTLLVGLALREAVPGRAVPSSTAAVVLGFGFALQLVVGIATWLVSPGAPFSWSGFSGGVVCMQNEVTFALPALIVTLWLVFRAAPVRPSMAGLFGGTGAGLVADAINHLICPMSDLHHVVVWHTGAVVLLAIAGWLAGALWERVRRPV
jgi:hypothetical protein